MKRLQNITKKNEFTHTDKKKTDFARKTSD